MKILSILLLCGVFLSCAGGPIVITDPATCEIYAEFGATPENSLIAAKIPDPCLAKRILTVASKLPAIEWEQEYTDEFELWAMELEYIVAGGITYYQLQDLIIMEVTKINDKIGQALFVTSGLFVFNERGFLKEIDTQLVLALIKHLRAEVARMAVLYDKGGD